MFETFEKCFSLKEDVNLNGEINLVKTNLVCRFYLREVFKCRCFRENIFSKCEKSKKIGIREYEINEVLVIKRHTMFLL